MEEWKTIDGFSRYQVSNTGKVRTRDLEDYYFKEIDYFYKGKPVYKSKKALTTNIKLHSNKEMSLQRNSLGYLNVGLRADNGEYKQFRVHRLVLQTFKPNDNADNLVVDHINGIRDDNRLENLRWATRKQNSNNLHEIKPRYNAIKIKDNKGNVFNSYKEASDYYKVSVNTIKNHAIGKHKKYNAWKSPEIYGVEFEIIKKEKAKTKGLINIENLQKIINDYNKQQKLLNQTIDLIEDISKQRKKQKETNNIQKNQISIF